MARRVVLPLLALLALLAGGVWWLARSIEPAVHATDEVAAHVETAPAGSPGGSDVRRTPDLDSRSIGAGDEAGKHAASDDPRRESAATAQEELELAEAIWVEGRVIVPEGTPSDEHAEVVADGLPFASRPDYRAPIGADGSFRVAFAKDTHNGVLLLDARYLYLDAPRTLDLSSGKLAPDAKTVLRPRVGGWIRGRLVLHPNALPLRASAVAGRVRLSADRSAPVDSNLAFELRAVSVGGFTISVEAPPLIEVERRDVVVKAGSVHDVEIELQLGATLTGEVVDSEGHPMEDARVRVHRRGSGDGSYAATDQGRFRIEGLAPGAVSVTANADGCSVSEPIDLDLQAGQLVEGLHVVLGRSARLAGRVLGADGLPVQLAEVKLIRRRDVDWRAGLPGSLVDRTDRGGAFAFENLSAGTYALEASVRVGHDEVHVAELDASKELTLHEGDRVDDVEVRLQAGCRAEGLVTDASGRPVARARVWARTKGAGASRSSTANTDGAGRFVMLGLVAGEWTFWAQQGLDVSPPSKPVAVDARTNAKVDLRIQPGTMLYVSAKDANGPVLDAVISVTDERAQSVPGWSNSQVATQENRGPDAQRGRTFGPLPAGRYEVSARSGSKSATRTVTLEGQAQETVTLELAP